jgi:diguanylate cyclase (GGDEF)-like protein
LDLDIPYASGLDLCQLVRSDAHWCGLPILFLTAHRDAKTVNQVFAAGADDFVSKPIVESEIVTRVINRIERTRLLRNLVETDPMTGTLNRHRFIQGMIQLLYLADRHRSSVCLVVVKIPQLSQLVACYGYGFGDDLLRRLGQHLQPQFRREDLVARWEYDTFVVAMYPTQRPDAYNRLHRALVALHQEVFVTPHNTEIKVVFSFGVAESGRDGNDLQSLYQSAKADFYHQMGKQVSSFATYPLNPTLSPGGNIPKVKGPKS